MRCYLFFLLISVGLFAQENVDEVTLLRERVRFLEKQNQEQQAHLNYLYTMSYYQQALECFRLQRYSKAIEYCIKALEYNNAHIPSLECLGLSYIQLKDYKKAFLNFKTIINSNPKHVESYLHLGEICFLEGRYEQAVDNFSNVVALDPNYKDVFYDRAHAYLALKDYENAIADFSVVIKQYPDDAAAYHNRANIYSLLGIYQNAIDDFTKAISINNEKLRHSYYDLKGYENTPKEVGGIILKQHASYYNRSLVYSNLKQYLKAIDDLSQAIALRPDDPRAYQRRAANFFSMEEYRKAADDFTQAIAITKDDANLYIWRADAYSKFLDLQFMSIPLDTSYKAKIAAEQDYRQAIELRPNDSSLYSKKALLNYHNREYQKAIEDFSDAIKLNPNAIDYCNRGNSYYQSGEYDMAFDDYQMALEINPRLTAAYCNIAKYYNRKREYQKALDSLEEAIRIDPRIKDEVKKDIEEIKDRLNESQ